MHIYIQLRYYDFIYRIHLNFWTIIFWWEIHANLKIFLNRLKQCESVSLLLMYKIWQSNIVKIGYDISGEIVPRVQFLQRNRTHSCWVQFLLGTISPGYDFSWHPGQVSNRKKKMKKKVYEWNFVIRCLSDSKSHRLN